MKTKVRNILLLSVTLVLALSFCLALFGCGGDGDSTKDADYILTFDLNYSGSKSKNVGVKDGEYTMPSDPERSGYLFTGWYADEACTVDFDFDEISSDATVYAGWLQKKEGYCYLSMVYNLTGYGTYKVAELEDGQRVADGTSNPTLSGYKFKGWYTDAACTSAVSSNAFISSDMTLYASWYKGWKFEAENTNTKNDYDEERAFSGYSENGVPIKSDSSCSGGYYFGNMNVNGCYIEFEVYCSTAVSDATISLQAALIGGWNEEKGGFTDNIPITSDDFVLTVNDNPVSYATMTFVGAANLSTGGGDRTDFKLYELGTISLNSGWNTVRFTVNNTIHGYGGTQEALAPLVDYMMLYVPLDASMEMKTY